MGECDAIAERENADIDTTDVPEGWATPSLSVLATPDRPRRDPADWPALPFVGMEQVEAHTQGGRLQVLRQTTLVGGELETRTSVSQRNLKASTQLS